MVVVEQDYERQTVRMTALRGDSAAVVPVLPLRGRLFFQVGGYAAPLTLCGPAEELDVEPCVDGAALALRLPGARLDEEGVVHFADVVPIEEAREMLRSDRLPIPVTLDEETLATLAPRLVLRPLEPLVFERGRALFVRVEPNGDRLLASVLPKRASDPALLFFEPAHVTEGKLRIVSVGTEGIAGHRGADGMRGRDGSRGRSASCPSSRGESGSAGGRGGDGRDGARGGPGGRGGSIDVVVHCEEPQCEALGALARRLVESRGGTGGPGGAGGRGGRGGRGGDGGSGTSCRDSGGRSRYLSSGSRGRDGTDGRDGRQGPRGMDGPPGRVRVHYEPPR